MKKNIGQKLALYPTPATVVGIADEVARLEQLADATGIDTRGGWEHSME